METQVVVNEPTKALTQSWTKPLTQDETFLVDLLTQKYEGVSPAFEKVENETSVTVSIPRLHHIFGSRA